MGIGALKRAVFLDRDGVLNRAIVRDGKPYPPDTIAELVVEPDAPTALGALKAAGFLLIVVTNQPDVGRGTQTRAMVEAIHSALARELPIDEFVTCYHDGRENCSCRKPKPGMVLEAAARHGVELAESYLIGDRWRDIDCGHAAGVRTVWLERGYTERGPEHAPDYRCGTLTEAVWWITQ